MTIRKKIIYYGGGILSIIVAIVIAYAVTVSIEQIIELVMRWL